VATYADFIGFDWDDANRSKNWRKHRVAWWECEEVFFNHPIFVLPDEKHSMSEPRYYALGVTHRERRLFLVFTRRINRIRIVSARDMNKKERKIYFEKAQTSAKS
jgi:uncharacterized protein